jgi:hypothetical protein
MMAKKTRKWAPGQLEKFRATMAATQKESGSIPLDAIPARINRTTSIRPSVGSKEVAIELIKIALKILQT